MGKVELGALGNYVSEELLLKTNIFDFLTQDIIDDFNEILTTNNPRHIGNSREWDYADFKTNKGNTFYTTSIYYATYLSPEFDDLLTTLFFKKDNSVYVIKTFVIDNYKEFLVIKGDNSSLAYGCEDGQITIKEVNGPFKFIEQNAEGNNEQE